MNFNQAVTEVVGIVKRPELIEQVRREVNSAIAFYCLDGEWANDYLEQTVVLDPLQYTQSFSKADLTRFRKFRFLKRGGTRSFLSLATPLEMSKGCTGDKYYEAGTNVNVSLSKLSATLDVGYYSYPAVLTSVPTNGAHWMLDMFPYMIIERAAAKVFEKMGDEKSMATYFSSARELYLAFRKDQASSQ